MTASIGESLEFLAHARGDPRDGLNDDEINIIALRLIIECDPPVLDGIGRIVEQVRQAEGDRRPEREREARRKVIDAHTADDARTGVHPVPRRPEFVRMPEAPERTDHRRVPSR